MNARAFPMLVLCCLLPPAVLAGDAGAIEAGGGSFPAIIAGDGPPVVFVHGMLADARAWAGLAEATAADGHRFVAYTQHGFGPGSTPDVEFTRDRHVADLVAILEATDGPADGPADLVAWSYGGAVALGAALAAPDRVKRIVLYEPYLPELIPLDTPEQQAADEAFTAAMGPTAAAMEAGDKEGAARAAVEALLGLGAGGFAAEPAEVQAIQLDNAASFAATWSVAEPKPIGCDALGGLRAPTLVVIGGTTLPGFAEVARAVAGCIPGARTATLPGQGHGGPIFAGDAFGRLALDFVDGS